MARNYTGYAGRGMWWGGSFVQGVQYEQNVVVKDGDWLMIANKGTTAKAAPVPEGDPFWMSGEGDAPTWENSNVSQSSYVTGQRVSVIDGIWEQGFRVWFPEITGNISYDVYIVTVLAGELTVETVLKDHAPAATGWAAVSSARTPVPAGGVFDIVLVAHSNTGVVNTDADYAHLITNNAPLAGQSTQLNNDAGTARFNHIDNDTTDRQTLLESLKAGDTITPASIAGTPWTVVGKIDNPAFVEYLISPGVTAGTVPQTFTFGIFGSEIIDINKLTDHYITPTAELDVWGFEGDSYSEAVETLNRNAYGVDLFVQAALASPDWDFLSYSGA